jgi:hypothetical protein
MAEKQKEPANEVSKAYWIEHPFLISEWSELIQSTRRKKALALARAFLFITEANMCIIKDFT